MDDFNNWEQMDVLQRVTTLTALIDETKEKGVNTREAEGLMQLATTHIDSEEYDEGKQLLQKTYFSLKRIREQHLDDPAMMGGKLEQPPPPPPDDNKGKGKNGRPRPTKGRCTICKGENLQFNDNGTGECPDCRRKFFWDKSQIPPPEPEMEKTEPEEAPLEGIPSEKSLVEIVHGPAPVDEIIREEAPLEMAIPEPEPSVPADPMDQEIEVTQTSPPMAKPPPPASQEIDLMKVEDEKKIESVSVIVPKEEIPDDPPDEPPKPEDDLDIDGLFDMGGEGGAEAKEPAPTEEEEEPEPPVEPVEPEPPKEEEEAEPPKEEEEPPKKPVESKTPEDMQKDWERIQEEKLNLLKERGDVQARIKALEEELSKGN